MILLADGRIRMLPLCVRSCTNQVPIGGRGQFVAAATKESAYPNITVVDRTEYAIYIF